MAEAGCLHLHRAT